MCEEIIGRFEFKHWDGPGYYTFAPRFYSWSQNPKVAEQKHQEHLIDPYDPQNPPNQLSDWSKEFLKNGA